MDFMFDEIPYKLVPFDYPTFEQSPQRYFIGTTNCHTGAPVYFEKKDGGQDLLLKALRASSSLPFVSPIVTINGLDLLDGGISDPIPVHKSITDGNIRHLIVLTRPQGYRKKAFKQKWFAKRFYRNYEGLVEAMLNRHQVYNSTLDLIEDLEQKGQAIVIRPTKPLPVDRLEKNPQKLTALYDLGYEDAQKIYPQILHWLNMK